MIYAKRVKVEDSKILVLATETNKVMFEWVEYPSFSNLFYHIVSGNVKFKYKNDVCEKINIIMDNISTIHAKSFPDANVQAFNAIYNLSGMVELINAEKSVYISELKSKLDLVDNNEKNILKKKIYLYDIKYNEIQSHVNKMSKLFENTMAILFTNRQSK